MDNIFTIAARNKKSIIWFFWIIYAALLCLIVLGRVAIDTRNSLALFFVTWGLTAGKTAIVLFLIVGLPGICRRFRVRSKVVSLIMLFRRQLGISVFMLVLTHFMLVRFSPTFFANFPDGMLFFEILGFTALCFLAIMFSTSNDFSVRRLGKWWNRIHYLFYIIVWLVFFHVMLQRWSIWSILIGSLAILEVISFIYFFLTKPRPQSPPVTPAPPVAQP